MRRRLDGWIFKEMVWGNDEGENSWVNLERPRGEGGGRTVGWDVGGGTGATVEKLESVGSTKVGLIVYLLGV